MIFCSRILCQGNLDAKSLETLRASPEVESIEEDGIMSIFVTQFVPFPRLIKNPELIRFQDQRPMGSRAHKLDDQPCWPERQVGYKHISPHLVSSSKGNSALTFSYTYDASAGAGVDIYIIGM